MKAAAIEASVQEAGLHPLSQETAARFETYLELLLKWNAKLNLTAIREPEAIVTRHFLESIFAAQQLPADVRTLLDFGSGGGFPGIPIALSHPQMQVTLGESQSKKASFLREVVRTLDLHNCEVHGGRVEGLSQEFDVVAMRAVDKMQEACREAIRKVSLGGYLVILTTDDAVPSIETEFDQIIWAAPLLIPKSTQRVLLTGRKDHVPRGTK